MAAAGAANSIHGAIFRGSEARLFFEGSAAGLRKTYNPAAASAAAGGRKTRFAVTESARAAPANIARRGCCSAIQIRAHMKSARASPYPRAAAMKSRMNGLSVISATLIRYAHAFEKNPARRSAAQK